LTEVRRVDPPHPEQIARPLRVAFCIDNMNIGGTELNAVRTAPLLLAAGIDLSVFSLSGEGPLLDRYAKLGIPVEVLPLTSLYGPGTWKSGRRLARLVRRRKIDLVHAHDFYSNIFAAPWSRVGGAAFIASRRWWEGPERRAQRWANRAAYLLANRVLANSPSVAELLVHREWVRRRRVVVVPNFLDEAAFDEPPADWAASIARELGLPADRLVVGVVANLSPIKDHATLFRAVASLAHRWPALRLVLVGSDGGSRGDLERLAGELGLADRIHFAGHRPNLPSPHHLFDVSVLTSVSEGMPNSILEAMASAKPVVATSVGAIPDAVADGVTGFLVPPRDPDRLRERLHLLLSDAELRRRLGEAGRAKARAEYAATAAITRLVDTYRAVAGQPRLSAKPA
jgi:glycosyltransferase involved in cell wall biosynthesis